jgi:hypothetical protein
MKTLKGLQCTFACNGHCVIVRIFKRTCDLVSRQGTHNIPIIILWGGVAREDGAQDVEDIDGTINSVGKIKLNNPLLLANHRSPLPSCTPLYMIRI